MFRSIAAPLAAAFLISATPALAQTEDAKEAPHPFLTAIDDSIREITRDADGNLSGPGWELLLAEAAKAQFFLIGETHATADIALVASAIHRGIAPAGYEHLVVEIGPWSTRHTEALIRSGEGGLTGYVAAPRQAFNLPFLSFAEEIAFVEQAVALSPHGSEVLWGVDQEFIASGVILGPILIDLAETEAQRAAAQDFADKSAANFMHVAVAPQEEIDALIAAFADGSPEARELVDGIAITHRVYGPFVRGSGPIYFGNLERENYMKRNFLKHFTAAEERLGRPPKALFKFGGYHLERGLSGTNVPSFGNFLMEWGRARDFGTVHVMIDCLGGEAWAIQQNKPQPCAPYAMDTESPLFKALEGRATALVDLAALRPLLRSNTPIDAKTRDLILSYDYYLALSEVKAGTPAGDLTFPPQ